MGISYFIGLDLGQAQDYTALAVLERSARIDSPDYSIRHLQRFPLGTPYTAIVPAVVKLAKTSPLAGRCTLVVDQIGVGGPWWTCCDGSPACHAPSR